MTTFTRLIFVLGTILTLVTGPVGVQAATNDTSGDGSARTATESPPKPPEFSQALISCLKSVMGDAAYAQISSGEREATDDEFDKGDTCFEQFGPKIDPAQQPKAEDLKFAPGTETCLKEKLGDNFRSEFAGTKTKEQAKALRTKTKDCFGKNVAGNQPTGGAPGQLPDDVKSCIVGAVGQAEADNMLKGNPPQLGSELFKKIESAKCFKNFGPSPAPGHDRPELSEEKKACVEKIMGHKFEDTRTEPTEEMKQQIGKECFGGAPGGPGGPGAPQMPEAVQSCLNSAFGDQLEDLKKGPEFLTDEQKSKANDCFKKSNFNPGGEHGGPGGPNGGPQLSDEARSCVEKIMGKLDGPKEPTEEQKQRVGKECFGGQGGPGGPGGPGGGPGMNLPPEKRECVEKILGGGGVQPTEEQKQQIGKECFGGGGPGGSGGPGGPEGAPSGQKNECVDRITGGQAPSADQQQQIGRECFGGQSGPAPTSGDSGRSNGPTPFNDSGVNRPTGAPEANPGFKACVDRITGGTAPSPDQQAQIQRECVTAH